MDAGPCFEAEAGEEKHCEAETGPGSFQDEHESVEGCQASP